MFSTNRFALQNKIPHLLNLAWGCIKPSTVRKWSKTSLPQGKQYSLKKYTFTSTECILHTFFTFISDSVLVRFTQQYWEKDDLDLTEGQNVHNCNPLFRIHSSLSHAHSVYLLGNSNKLANTQESEQWGSWEQGLWCLLICLCVRKEELCADLITHKHRSPELLYLYPTAIMILWVI